MTAPSPTDSASTISASAPYPLYLSRIYAAARWLTCNVALGAPLYLIEKSLFRVRVHGRGNLDRVSPPVIFVSNHVTMIDWLLMYELCWPRWIAEPRLNPLVLADRRNFFGSSALRILITMLGGIPVDRGIGLEQRGVATAIAAIRRRSQSLLLYPEGGRTREPPRLKPRGQPGVGRIIREVDCPVIPFVFGGMEACLPVGARVPRMFTPVELLVGTPMDFSTLRSSASTAATWSEITSIVMDRLRSLQRELDVATGGSFDTSP